MAANFICNVAATASPLPHFWEHTVGSDHAVMALREDWRGQLKRAHTELGFRYVRFHGLLDDDMSILTAEGADKIYSFFNADSIFDFLHGIGMRPFVELSFMPLALASGSQTVFHYRGNVTPPKAIAEWCEFITKLVQHCVDRYGADEVRQWFFEVWNEPNLIYFGNASMAEYFEFYAATVRAVKAVDPALRVGGPATAANAWVAEFVAYCRKTSAPVDFVSTHHYPTNSFGKPGDDTITELSLSRRSVLRDEAAQAKLEAGGLPLYYTEWCTSSNPRDSLHDEPYAAAFIVKTILEANGLVDGYSYWTFSDIFEENYFPSQPFHGGFGLLSIHGVAKPAYRAFDLLHRLGDALLLMTGAHPTVDAWAARKGADLDVVLTNFALPRHDIAAESVTVRVEGVSRPATAAVTRIDADHANPKRAWQAMGQPEYPTRAQIAALNVASELNAEVLETQMSAGAVTFTIQLPPLSVAVVSLPMALANHV